MAKITYTLTNKFLDEYGKADDLVKDWLLELINETRGQNDTAQVYICKGYLLKAKKNRQKIVSEWMEVIND